VKKEERVMNNLLLKVVYGILPFGRLFLQIIQGKEFGFSFNLADRCPIGCDCYWRAMGRVKELTDEQVVEFFHEQKKQGKLHVTIVGGEPYVRPKLLRLVTPIMPGNWVVTSGTTPLMVLPRTTHFISIDGKNAATHDKVRKMIGLYERILKNLTAIRPTGEFPAFIHTVLNAANYRQIGEILRTWHDNDLADGVTFSTITHIKGGGDDSLLLTRDQQQWIAEELLKQKEVFGNFLCMTEGMITMYKPSRTERQTPASCGTAKFIASFDASCNRIPQCIFSDKGDCSRCGCVITPMIESVTNFPPSPAAIKLLAHLYTP